MVRSCCPRCYLWDRDGSEASHRGLGATSAMVCPPGARLGLRDPNDGRRVGTDRHLPRRVDGIDAATRRLHGARVPGPARAALPLGGPGRTGAVPRPQGRAARGTGLEGVRALDAGVQLRELAGALPGASHPGRASIQPAGVRLGPVGPVVQHCIVVRQQHELAVLRRGDDALLLLTDGRDHRRELHVVCGRDGRRGRVDPRTGATGDLSPRQLLGRSDPLAAVCAAAAVGPRRFVPRLAGGPPKPVELSDRRRADSPVANDRDGTGRIPGGDQADVRRRRRVLQHELGPPVREPHRPHELRRGAVDAADPCCDDLHVRADGRPRPPRLGALHGDAGAVHRRRRHPVRGREPRHTGDACRRVARAEHAGQGTALRDRRLHTVRGGWHRKRRRRGQQRSGGLHRARKRRRDGEHHDRRGHLRRPRLRLFGMLLLVVLSVFIAGLMVGRTPEYLGKKIGIRETKLAVLGTLFVPTLVLATTAITTSTSAGTQSLFSHGPQGFSESLYAYLSQTNNNGSAFAGYTGFIQPSAGNLGSHGIAFADIAGGLVMTFVRFIPILFVFALAGSLATRRVTPASLGTLRTDTPTFVVLLIGFVIVFALLNFLAALFLGPLDQSLTQHLY